MAIDSVFSETLESITNAKLLELSSKRAAFDTRHAEAIKDLESQGDPLTRVNSLLEGVKHCFDIDTTSGCPASNRQNSTDKQLGKDLNCLGRFLEQAKVDPSLSGRILKEWEQTLVRHLDIQAHRYQYATLYGQLVTEWLSPDNVHHPSSTATSADVQMGDDFEDVPAKKRLDARLRLESSIFTPADVNEAAIKEYLEELFSDGKGSDDRNVRKALNALRESAQKFESQLAKPDQFNTRTVSRSIHGLLESNLFAGEKRTALKDFENNNTILSEIADVLNMRMAAFSTWSWGIEGVPIEQRRGLDGRFDTFMHEDLLQAIFLQFIGVEWSVFFKTALGRFRRQAWKSNFQQISRIEKRRREYYLGPQQTDKTLARIRRRTYRKGYFLYHLLDWPEQEIDLKDGEEEAELSDEEEPKPKRKQLSSKAARKSAPSTGPVRAPRPVRVDDEETEDDSDGESTPKKPMGRKQNLLHLLATEASLNLRVKGTFTAFRSTFDELVDSLPHQAIIMVLSFFGVSTKWTNFFRTYLEAPLRFMEDAENGTNSCERKRGVPTSHTLSDVFSETMLFCFDFSVNRRTDGGFLYRLADDFWFWSHDHNKVIIAWKEAQVFANAFGLSMNHAKSGSISINDMDGQSKADGVVLPKGRIRWGMMYFDPESLRFKIDQNMVNDHIEELKKQLAAKGSVFDWIQVWNAYANTFFTSNFGKMGDCFGREHVDEILATHQRIQKTIFDGKDVAQHVKSMIEERFGVNNIADGFLFFPVESGGLGLRSPFVSPLLVRRSIAETSSKILDDFDENEKQDYWSRKEDFDKGNDPEGREDVTEPNWKPSQGADEFMSYEEYIKYREEFTNTSEDDTKNFLLSAYVALMKEPEEQNILPSPAVVQALGHIDPRGNAGGLTHHWYSMEAYWKWTAQLYGPEMIERFGGLRAVEPGLLPIGMVGLFRDEKVKLQD